MRSKHTVGVRIIPVDTTEEFVLNPKGLAPELRNWRIYRLEFGGANQDCVYEGRIILPRRANPDAIAQLIMGMQTWEQMWKEVEETENDDKE